MTGSPQSFDEIDLETRLNGQTAKIHWHELQRHYAGGVIRQVARGADLVAVGKAIIDNDSEQVQRWLTEECITVPDADCARAWFDNNTELWALVVAPWVLVQEPD